MGTLMQEGMLLGNICKIGNVALILKLLETLIFNKEDKNYWVC